MGSPRALASLLVSALLCAPATGLAQPKPNDANLKKAGELVRAAITKSQAGDHQAAIDLYLNAYMLVPNAALLSNIGSEFQQINKPVEALKYFCKYLDADPTGANAPYASAQAKTLEIQLGGSSDDKSVCKPIQPQGEKPPLLPMTGNGGMAGSATEPGAGSGAPVSGLHDQPVDTSQPGSQLKVAGLVTAGVGVIALGFGIAYGLDAQAHSDFENNFKANNPPGTPWPSNIRAYEQEGRDLNTKQVVFTVIGGVAVVTGVVVYFLGRSKASSAEHVAVRPLVSPSLVGVSLSAGF